MMQLSRQEVEAQDAPELTRNLLTSR